MKSSAVCDVPFSTSSWVLHAISDDVVLLFPCTSKRSICIVNFRHVRIRDSERVRKLPQFGVVFGLLVWIRDEEISIASSYIQVPSSVSYFVSSQCSCKITVKSLSTSESSSSYVKFCTLAMYTCPYQNGLVGRRLRLDIEVRREPQRTSLNACHPCNRGVGSVFLGREMQESNSELSTPKSSLSSS